MVMGTMEYVGLNEGRLVAILCASSLHNTRGSIHGIEFGGHTMQYIGGEQYSWSLYVVWWLMTLMLLLLREDHARGNRSWIDTTYHAVTWAIGK